MGLPSKNQAAFVADMVSTWASLLGFQPTLPSGDPFLALMQTVASQFVFLQALAQTINAVARAQTSTGADLDTFYAQFGFPRLPATFAEGPATFGKLSPAASQVLIPPGVVVQTAGGAIIYQTIADASQPTWNAGLNAYVLAPGETSLLASIQALVAGSSYNVAANQISQIASALPGIDTVNNASPISDGADAESDASYRSRFVLFLNSLSKATYGAIVSAIMGVQQGIEFNLLENVNVSGGAQPGEFVAVIDNGTGSPPQSLLDAVQAILEVTRGFTIEAQTIAANVDTATIVLAIKLDPAYVENVVLGNVANAVAVAVNATPIGGGELVNGVNVAPGWLFCSTINAAAKSVAGVVSVQEGATTINSVPADKSVAPTHAARTDVDHISVGTY